MIVTSIPTTPFFSHYGNVERIDTQVLVALDKNMTILAAGPNINLVGRDFFGEDVQQFVNHNEILNNLTTRSYSGANLATEFMIMEKVKH